MNKIKTDDQLLDDYMHSLNLVNPEYPSLREFASKSTGFAAYKAEYHFQRLSQAVSELGIAGITSAKKIAEAFYSLRNFKIK